MESTSKGHTEGMERGVADARVADYGEVSSGMESDSDNGVDLGPIPSEGPDDDEDHDAAIRVMEAVLRKARRPFWSMIYLLLKFEFNISNWQCKLQCNINHGPEWKVEFWIPIQTPYKHLGCGWVLMMFDFTKQNFVI